MTADGYTGNGAGRLSPVRVAVDAMGGDRGPEEIVRGALEAARDDVQPIVFGAQGLDTGGLELVETAETIGMQEKPAEAVRAKPDSSLVRACRAVAEGDADVVVSAGNTGAMLAAGLLELRRLSGVQRPAIAVPLPTVGEPSVMLDCGANADARAEHLVQFAHMGSIFAEEILELTSPRVRLLSIGEEDEKGNQLTLDAHRTLAGDSELDFAGNVESRHLLETPGQVVVCDGFTGNVCLKAIEGTILTVMGSLRQQLRSSWRGVVAGFLMRPAARSLRARLDPDTHGGAYLLGLRHLAVIAHGNSSSNAIANAVLLAGRGVQHRVVERLADRFGEAPALAGQSARAERL